VRGFSQLFIFPAISARTTVMTLQLVIPLVALGSLLLFLGNDSFPYLMGAMVLFSLSYPALLPLNETSASLLTKLDHFDYGRSRQWGSIGFTVALASTGVLLDWFGANAIVWAIAVSLALLALHARMEAPRVFTVPSKTSALAGWGELFRNREFLFVLGIVTMV
ncbi:MAG: MFS transporter, partial [Bacilli bacterium]